MALKTKRFINGRNSCSCSMTGVWRAVSFMQGVAAVFHSPRACAHVARAMELGSHYRALSDLSPERMTGIPLLSSQLTEQHTIFGGAEQLAACLRFAAQTYKPQCIVIANSCVSGVIGDDVEAVGAEMEAELGLPVLTVDCYGFLNAEYYDGYYAMTEQLIKRFFRPQPKQSDTVLILGDSGGPWGLYASEVRRLLQALQLEVIGQFPGYMPLSEVEQAARAQASVILGGRGKTYLGLRRIAQKLEKDYDIKALCELFPVDLKQTKNWLLYVARFFGREERALQLLAAEDERLQLRLRQFLPVTRRQKTVLCIGRYLEYFNPAATLELIGLLELDLLGIVLLDAYEPKGRQEMLTALQALTDKPVYDAAAAEELCARADLVLTTHELQQDVRQIFLPMIPEVGYTGALKMLQGIYRRLCSRRQGGGITYV